MNTYDRIFSHIQPKMQYHSKYWEHVSNMKKLTKLVKEELAKVTHD